jgi:hypothetical protein
VAGIIFVSFDQMFSTAFFVQAGHVTDVKKLYIERHVCGTFHSAHFVVSRYRETSMPEVETDNDATDDNLQSGVVTFFGARGECSEWPPLTEIMNFAYVIII